MSVTRSAPRRHAFLVMALSRHRTHQTLVALAALALPACGEPTPEERGSTCLSTTRAIDDSRALSELNFSARDVLAWAVRTESQTVDWNDQHVVEVDSNIRTPNFVWSLQRGDGPARVVENDCKWHDTYFSPRLQIPARIALTLGDGHTLNLPATISARRKGFATVDSAANASALAQLPIEARPPSEILSRRLRIAIDEQSSAGSLDISMHLGEPSRWDPESALLNIFSWPLENPCGLDVIAHTRSGAEPEWLKLAVRGADLRWAGFDAAGTRTHDVSIELADAACHDELDPLRLPATLRIGVAGEDPLVFTGEFREHEGSAVFTLEQWAFVSGSARFAANFPELSTTSPGDPDVRFEVELKVSADTARGTFAVVRKREDCEAPCTATGCTGCEGMTAIQLAQFSLSPEP